MTQEEKQLLAKDIFGRVLTGLKVDYHGETFTLGYNLYLEDGNVAFESYPMNFYLEGIETVKPYLRPMSSMTEEERAELKDTTCPEGTGYFDEQYLNCPINHFGERIGYDFMSDILDWLNAHHFDYRGLIEKGLALEAKEWMYKTE